MKMGRIELKISYPVNLEDQTMVDHAKDSVFDDIGSMVKFSEEGDWIKVIEDSSLKESDIPSFLLEDRKKKNKYVK